MSNLNGAQNKAQLLVSVCAKKRKWWRITECVCSRELSTYVVLISNSTVLSCLLSISPLSFILLDLPPHVSLPPTTFIHTHFFYPPIVSLSLPLCHATFPLFFLETLNKSKASLSQSASHFLCFYNHFTKFSVTSVKNKHSVWKQPRVALSYTQWWVETGVCCSSFFFLRKSSQQNGSIMKWGFVLTR